MPATSPNIAGGLTLPPFLGNRASDRVIQPGGQPTGPQITGQPPPGFAGQPANPFQQPVMPPGIDDPGGQVIGAPGAQFPDRRLSMGAPGMDMFDNFRGMLGGPGYGRPGEEREFVNTMPQLIGDPGEYDPYNLPQGMMRFMNPQQQRMLARRRRRNQRRVGRGQNRRGLNPRFLDKLFSRGTPGYGTTPMQGGF